MDKTTLKKSRNDYYQDLLNFSLDKFFEDYHKPIINDAIAKIVSKVFKDNIKYMVNELKGIFISNKYDVEYLKALSNILFKLNVEAKYKSDDRDFFDDNVSVHSEFLEIPITMEKYANNLEKKKQVHLANFKKNK
ncbi:hypothetical protein [Spiroplasma taiwanense]|uniref:Uncharacterized protein n=1 Tax=Spiroplasma taiwanense CT-1 TaxID=1276220 RepID=S5LV93_9MOLU|nr:hypothetical protein [Spiroplasma taiwanense]AGR41704.1 hypothetical protein STAIW_v1c11210 [Spiroplasma taiwanense CT-1]